MSTPEALDTKPHNQDETGIHSDAGEHGADGPALTWRELSRVLFVAVAGAAVWLFRGASSPSITVLGVLCTSPADVDRLADAIEAAAA